MDDLGDLDIVDKLEFQYLVTQIAALEEHVKLLNENLMHVTNLLHELVYKHALENSMEPMVMDGAMESPSSDWHST